MNKQKQIDDLKQNILNAKNSIEQAESKIKQLEEEEGDFKLTSLFKNFNCWCEIIIMSIDDLYQLINNKKTYAEFKLKYIAYQLNKKWDQILIIGKGVNNENNR